MPTKNCAKIFKDGTKWLMVPSKIMLECICMWPEDRNVIKNLVSLMYFTSFLIALLGQVSYTVDKFHDLPKFATGLSFICLSVEALLRRFLCYVYLRRFKLILTEVYINFWPSTILGKTLHKEISQQSFYLASYFLTCTFFAFVRSLEGVALSLFLEELPLFTKCPVCHRSPYYEIIYLVESLLVVETAFNVCGFDFFVSSLILNCASQFKLLRCYIKQEFEKNVSENLTSQRWLLKKVIERHNSLISVCKEFEKIITHFALIQYLMSVGTICLSSFVAVAIPEELKNALPFAFGHTCLIFAYCWMGENLSYESTLLANTIYECNWHLWNEDKSLQKDILMVLNRSQKPITISVGGFGYLNFTSFMKLVQFTFSVFTFLNKIMKGQGIGGIK